MKTLKDKRGFFVFLFLPRFQFVFLCFDSNFQFGKFSIFPLQQLLQFICRIIGNNRSRNII